MNKKKQIKLEDLIREYAELELEIRHPFDDILQTPFYTYFLKMDWLDGKRYGIFVDITLEAIRECKFDITQMEVDKMMDKFIEKLENFPHGDEIG